MSDPMKPERLAEIRRNEAEVADYISDGLMRSNSAYRDRTDLLAEVDRLNRAGKDLGAACKKIVSIIEYAVRTGGEAGWEMLRDLLSDSDLAESMGSGETP